MSVRTVKATCCSDRTMRRTVRKGRRDLSVGQVEETCRTKQPKRLAVRKRVLCFVAPTSERGLSSGQFEETCRLDRSKGLVSRNEGSGLGGQTGRRGLSIELKLRALSGGRLEGACPADTSKGLVGRTAQKDLSFGTVQETRPERRFVSCRLETTGSCLKRTKRLVV